MKPGDQVSMGDAVCEVQSDKVSLCVPFGDGPELCVSSSPSPGARSQAHPSFSVSVGLGMRLAIDLKFCMLKYIMHVCLRD